MRLSYIKQKNLRFTVRFDKCKSIYFLQFKDKISPVAKQQALKAFVGREGKKVLIPQLST
jgi:hypothetical protein